MFAYAAAVAASPRIRSDLERSKPRSLMLEGAGLGRMEPFFEARRLSAQVPLGHHPPRIRQVIQATCGLDEAFSSPSACLGFQRGTGRHHALGDEPPERDQKLPRQGHDGDALDAAASVADLVAI